MVLNKLKVKVKYLLWLRDKAGIESEEYILDNRISLSKLTEIIIKNHPQLSKYLNNVFEDNNPIIVLVNGVKRPSNYVLRDGDEIVFMPPVSGG